MNHDAVHLALRLRAKPALPTARAYENVEFTPTPGVEYVEEDFVPATSELRSATASQGTVQDEGLYVIRWFGVAGTGTTGVGAMSQSITALLARFAPGSSITASDGTVVRIKERPAPWRGQIIPNLIPGRAVATITIPWRVYSTNPALP
jgi:hypothetical protein